MDGKWVQISTKPCFWKFGWPVLRADTEAPSLQLAVFCPSLLCSSLASWWHHADQADHADHAVCSTSDQTLGRENEPGRTIPNLADDIPILK